MKPQNSVFAWHPRRWREYQYVYPVISRRSRGLSIGINLNPDGVCNFDCIYCQVDRRPPRGREPVDLDVVERELATLLDHYPRLFDEPEFQAAPPDYRRLNDIAFSGDGEPTATAVFAAAVERVARLRAARALSGVKTVLITNACFLKRAVVQQALATLDAHELEVWAKLDAGTDEYFARINRATHTLDHVVESIIDAARVRPVVIQSLFALVDGVPPSDVEIEAYVNRLQQIRGAAGQIARVQVYTVARRPAEPFVAPLSAETLEAITLCVRAAGFDAECFI